ncbi:hypothetical protein PVK06_013954 [Gossypium arboreum]|uniref:Uncharacterized protein n=1 Tax=Gossypium arboreum TaxID=29729 RepID=A0ABR0PT39_GOSAR|nr:hypothetical protein PVK06_013954 [Gossypium arboreum]
MEKGKLLVDSSFIQASEWSGIDTADAFAIDDTNLFHKLGLQTFINLSTNFYTRVYNDEEEWFRSIFANSKKEEAIQNQYEFFVERMGGPALYSEREVACCGLNKSPVEERDIHNKDRQIDNTKKLPEVHRHDQPLVFN